MKVLIGAVSATLLFVATAAAQTTTTTPPATPTPPAVTATSTCPPVPAQPAIPDGATATDAAFRAGEVALDTWVQAVNANLLCRATEVHQKDAERESLVQQRSAIRDAGLAATTALTEQQGIYQARHPSRRPAHNAGGAR